MPVNDELGRRMKDFYETIPKTKLMRRTPAAIRIDGKAFHTFTRGMKRPFDSILIETMQQTMKYLCENIQGCVLGYTQSDEITLILIDYQKLTSSAWFDYEVQKICSISASMATKAFNKYFYGNALEYILQPESREAIERGLPKLPYIINDYYGQTDDEKDYIQTLITASEKGAMFDARCFNIPKEEVTNCFIWRQQDATRNAIQMLGQSNFSHKELQGKSCSDIQDMLMIQKGINFNDMPTEFKRGICCFKTATGWELDPEIPVFTQDREYVERFIIEEN